VHAVGDGSSPSIVSGRTVAGDDLGEIASTQWSALAKLSIPREVKLAAGWRSASAPLSFMIEGCFAAVCWKLLV
jgi:hypothetical protein